MKRHRHRRKKVRAARWALLLLAAFVSFWLLRGDTPREAIAFDESTPVARSSDLAIAHESPSAAVVRAIYPYSVVPGGVANVAELKAAIAADPVVRGHYANFDVTRAHVVRTAVEKLVYVSYRRGGQIYWTKRPLKLASGENLITDGVITARSRCANQVSEEPRSPTADEDPQNLDSPEPAAPKTSSIVATAPGAFDIADWGAESFEKIPGTTPTAVSGPGSGGAPAGAAPVFIPFGQPVDGAADLPPTVQVPEPPTLLLLLASFPALWGFRKRKA